MTNGYDTIIQLQISLHISFPFPLMHWHNSEQHLIVFHFWFLLELQSSHHWTVCPAKCESSRCQQQHRAALTTEAQGIAGGVFAPPLLQPEKNSRRGSNSQSPRPFGHLFPSTAWLSPCGMEKSFWDVTSNAAAPTQVLNIEEVGTTEDR